MNAKNIKKIDLVLLNSLAPEIQMKVREIRNEANVRKWMYTDYLIGEDEHLAWLSKLKSDSKQIVFVVLDQKTPLGVVSINSIDVTHKKTDWAFYLTESARGGLGSFLEYEFINFIFDAFGMEKLNCEVIEGNEAVLKLHRKFLFQEEGFRRKNILKEGVRKGVHFLGLTKEDWQSGKNAIKENYKKIFENFAISINYDMK